MDSFQFLILLFDLQSTLVRISTSTLPCSNESRAVYHVYYLFSFISVVFVFGFLDYWIIEKPSRKYKKLIFKKLE